MAQAKTKSKTTKSKSRPKPKSRSHASSSKEAKATKPAPVAAAGKAADKATSAVGSAADKAKVPLVAGGAAIAGAAGGMAFGLRQARRKKSNAVRLGEFALQMQRARDSANGGTHHRSPVEVVLEGLTSRRSRA